MGWCFVGTFIPTNLSAKPRVARVKPHTCRCTHTHTHTPLFLPWWQQPTDPVLSPLYYFSGLPKQNNTKWMALDTEMYCLTKLGVQNQGVGRVIAIWNTKGTSSVPLPSFWSCWKSGIPGLLAAWLWSLLLSWHRILPVWSPCNKDTSHIGLGTHPTPEWPHLHHVFHDPMLK